ncbi:hypothetical protein FBEOM_7702 [Fusarium beomiforme]|uniref:Uncharacterized protein n=1 Tax=Fusarium beomiforme TaxID=44412 RepID=A0A9P5AGV3_9HYPO|nr:hypothetical protein FBEOM_7702 [Fusarium beomiforme]
MPPSPDTIPTTIDSSTEIIWPDSLPDTTPFTQADETPEPVKASEPDTSHSLVKQLLKLILMPKRSTDDRSRDVTKSNQDPSAPATTDDPAGHDLCLSLIINDEALELPRALKYPFWMEIPESQDALENELVADEKEIEIGMDFEMSDKALSENSELEAESTILVLGG